ncbi:hypothetical protein C8R44DRAFT_724493 [Mycena epipterygia]|nr:hypothetical protein C8R44DRAFT_724493 [Mycena epipterygia]
MDEILLCLLLLRLTLPLLLCNEVLEAHLKNIYQPVAFTSQHPQRDLGNNSSHLSLSDTGRDCEPALSALTDIFAAGGWGPLESLPSDVVKYKEGKLCGVTASQTRTQPVNTPASLENHAE